MTVREGEREREREVTGGLDMEWERMNNRWKELGVGGEAEEGEV